MEFILSIIFLGLVLISTYLIIIPFYKNSDKIELIHQSTSKTIVIKMTKKIKQINILFLSLFLIIQISSSMNQSFADEDLSINEINVNEYNMSVLSVNQNDQIISAITAVKIENPTEKTFAPNFTDVASTGMNFLRFSLPEGFTDLYVETDLPDGSLIELAKGFAITSDIPPGNFNIIFNFNVKYNSSELIFPLHLPHGAKSFKIIIPDESGLISGNNISYSKEINISSKIFDEYVGENYLKGDYLNIKMENIPTSFIKKITGSLNYEIINLVIIIIMINFILVFFIIRFFINKRKKNETT